MFSGKSLEGREGCAEQDGQGAGELDTDLQSWKHGEDGVGPGTTEAKISPTTAADLQCAGDGECYTVTIGSSYIRIGSISGGLRSHD